MKVYISADIEGITGLVSWSQCSRPDGKSFDYAFARRMMTHDVNAAIRGARAAGATEIVVKDSHGNSKNLLVDELEPGVQLVSGHGSGQDGMMAGIDGSFDAALLVGYHAMAGTLGGVMEHTITGGIHRLHINGQETGEIGLSAGTAGAYGVPTVFVASDAAGCAEAAAQIPGVVTFATKEGAGRYMGRLRHPSETGPGIADGVEAALRALRAPAEAKALPGGTEPGLVAQTALARSDTPREPLFRWSEPTSVTIEFNRAEEADMAVKGMPIDRIDGYTVGGSFPTFTAAHRAIWNLVELSFEGIGAQH